MVADLVPSSMVFAEPAPSKLQTWTHTPTLTAATTVGSLALPLAALSWTSSNPAVATVASNGVAKGLAPGSTTITATLNGVSASYNLTVTAPVLASVVDVVAPDLATPAADALQEIPVLIINYIPTVDGSTVQSSILGNSSITAFKDKLLLFNKRVKFMLEEGRRFRGYGLAQSRPSLG